MTVLGESGRGWHEALFRAEDGLELYARIYGDPGPAAAALPVVCLPGLTRNARDFDPLARILSSDPRRPRKVVAFDYRGRGRSAYDPDWRNYNLAVEADDVLAGLTALGLAKAVFIGTSRGGLIIHLLAALRPTVLKGAVLNDIGPVVEAEGLANIRSYLEGARQPASLADAVTMQKSLHGNSFPALAEADWQRLAQAIYRTEAGRPVADFDPALINVVKSFDPKRPAATLWPQFEALRNVPLLAIRGELSTLLSAQTLAEMAARHPDCETLTVPGQGHPPLLETGELPQRIAAFLARADRLAAD